MVVEQCGMLRPSQDTEKGGSSTMQMSHGGKKKQV